MSRRVVVTNAHPRYRIARQPVAKYVRKILKEEGKKNAFISVVLVDSGVMRTLHRAYLKRDATTDVISFPLESGRNLEGEIYVNLDRARRQGKECGVSFSNELARLVIHGTLHLMGYDDTRTSPALRMKKKEEQYVACWFSHEKVV
jgi:rRNA maturation RNase YbeY